ncbi:hypothetical protein HPB48_011621 [Haemaphysalis longicornis]|uniref:Uncharacterized protein n=1 Tax=Haemaphysalis longicornis TaxID=44386 RepID=A0A9J6G5I8_HAELO|nr:hypothetical protein HPB48_011621 [Haemaphysalis longicornis]
MIFQRTRLQNGAGRPDTCAKPAGTGSPRAGVCFPAAARLQCLGDIDLTIGTAARPAAVVHEAVCRMPKEELRIDGRACAGLASPGCRHSHGAVFACRARLGECTVSAAVGRVNV